MLGPVDVIDNGSTIALGGKQQRRLLAVLVANRGRVVPVDRLVEVLWPGEDGPIDAVATVHTYIARLRLATSTASRRCCCLPPSAIVLSLSITSTGPSTRNSTTDPTTNTRSRVRKCRERPLKGRGVITRIQDTHPEGTT